MNFCKVRKKNQTFLYQKKTEEKISKQKTPPKKPKDVKKGVSKPIKKTRNVKRLAVKKQTKEAKDDKETSPKVFETPKNVAAKSKERGRSTQKATVENWLLSFKNRSESCRKRVASAPADENKRSKSVSS